MPTRRDRIGWNGTGGLQPPAACAHASQPTATWGAYPGNSLDAVGSGIGIVHNSLLLDHTEKTVVRGPFRPFPRSVAGGEMSLAPRPPWFVTARTAPQVGRALAELGGRRTWRNTLKVVPAAMRG